MPRLGGGELMLEHLKRIALIGLVCAQSWANFAGSDDFTDAEASATNWCPPPTIDNERLRLDGGIAIWCPDTTPGVDNGYGTYGSLNKHWSFTATVSDSMAWACTLRARSNPTSKFIEIEHNDLIGGGLGIRISGSQGPGIQVRTEDDLMPTDLQLRVQYDASTTLIVISWRTTDSAPAGDWREVFRHQLDDVWGSGFSTYDSLELEFHDLGYAPFYLYEIEFTGEDDSPEITYTRSDLENAVSQAITDADYLIDLLFDRVIRAEGDAREAEARVEALIASSGSCTVDLKAGWNLVSVGANCVAPTTGTLSSRIWGWDGSQWFPVSTGSRASAPWHRPGVLVAGHGYWLFSSVAQELDLVTAPAP